MAGLVIGALILIAAVTGVAAASALIQRQQVGYRGNTSSPPGQLQIVLGDEPYPTPPPKVVLSDLPPPTDAAAQSPAARAAQISKALQKTDFSKPGGKSPVAQYMTTYLAGDDLFDESYHINNALGKPVGELGVSIAEAAEVDGHKNVVAFELWLFDIREGTTTNRLLVSEAAHDNETLRENLEKKGHVLAVRPGEWFNVDSRWLRVRARVFDAATKADTKVPHIVFKRLTLEIAVWLDDGQPVPQLVTEGQDESKIGALKEDSKTVEQAAVTALESIGVTDARQRLGGQKQEIKTSYLLRYPERLYLKQPFTLKITIPGGLAEDDPRRKQLAGRMAASSDKLAAEPGVMAFPHRLPPTPPEDGGQELPTISAALSFNPDEFYIPTASHTATLRHGHPVELEFPIKPLKAEPLLLAVKFYYVGKVWVPGKELEVTEIRDVKTGAVTSISTRKQPDRYTETIKHLATETLHVQVVSLLNLTAGAVSTLATALGLLLVIGFAAWAGVTQPSATPAEIGIAGGAALLAALILLGLPEMARRGYE